MYETISIKKTEKKGAHVSKFGKEWSLDGHEFEQALGVGDGPESLACCSPWGHKESDINE